ncbi:MAG: Gamma-glutamyltranspeptidase @ Glutathione hydrolase [uncultured Thermomicrobiales bacterium]|uniref:Glutathione hydrolase proenzyme n=1 Tax=uncultured Thermomicrobiales bacterium TaxID=1645740 RepID=A0A6J4UCN9_9BACT|nr:MAG: Gamma-glutamyltranspeptidase @ Glutathione hydrolase [uncultured Thermomicrobiales bacterium]
MTAADHTTPDTTILWPALGERPEVTGWVQTRTEARVASGGGMAAAKTPLATEAGAEMLRAGGNAVDAAVAMGFASGVVEPWGSGLGGGGYMVIQVPGEAAVVVEYPMVAPAGATPDMFPLAGGTDPNLFGWPNVVESANLIGHRSVAVPGTVAGLTLALERYGTKPLAEVMAPAIRYASDGIPVDVSWTYVTARYLAALSRFPESARVFLPNGAIPYNEQQLVPTIFRQPDLARTLEAIAAGGRDAFYGGDVADSIVSHLAGNGSVFAQGDLTGYEARVVPAASASYRGYDVYSPGGATGGTTLIQSLNILSGFDLAEHRHNSVAHLHVLAHAFRAAFADRFAYLADPTYIDVPLDALLSADYAAERAMAFAWDRVAPTASGDRDRLGVTHGLAASIPGYVTGGSTTHFSAIDGAGMAVSTTQTLLSLFGSAVTAPGTGVLLNNGMMWFDPEPGRPNSVEGGKRPLSNMAPVVIARDGQAIGSLGASGGRLIMNCNAQIAMNMVDFGLSGMPAVNAPRIDTSTRNLLVSGRLPRQTRDDLATLGHPVVALNEGPGSSQFSSPVGIRRHEDGTLSGGADIFYTATAIGVPGSAITEGRD